MKGKVGPSHVLPGLPRCLRAIRQLRAAVGRFQRPSPQTRTWRDRQLKELVALIAFPGGVTVADSVDTVAVQATIESGRAPTSSAACVEEEQHKQFVAHHEV